ncbi:MAG: YgiQ family radical SAM protein [Bacteroidales bacterium]
MTTFASKFPPTLSYSFPTSIKEMKHLGWEQADIILVSGDAFIDHPAFGTAVIARVLQREGYKVAIIPQPNWKDDLRDFKKLGEPRLFFGVTAGCLDSMVSHYTSFKRLRSDDAYTPGNKAGFRPDRAVTVYSTILKQLFPHIPVIIGGIEASLRRVTHYDFWDNSLHPSILLSSKADLLVYGMGEQPIIEISRLLLEGIKIQKITTLKQTAFLSDTANIQSPYKKIYLPSFEDCLNNKQMFSKHYTIFEKYSITQKDTVLIEPSKGKFVIINPPNTPVTTEFLDAIYSLPYTRKPHPRYKTKEPIPAFEMIKDSVTIHRGCFGACSFCAIALHQGKYISSRSNKSIIDELTQISTSPDFKGHITDLGGPSANMYNMTGKDKSLCDKCTKISCIHPTICKNLDTNHSALINLYKNARTIPQIKHLTIGSGIRYDLLSSQTPDKTTYLNELLQYHVSGRLKVAPEHSEQTTLSLMRKPNFEQFKIFVANFEAIKKKHNLKIMLHPYIISGHPGTTLNDMKQLNKKLNNLHLDPESIQSFTPTPMTLSSVMYYTETNPYTGEKIHVEKHIDKLREQKDALITGKKIITKK